MNYKEKIIALLNDKELSQEQKEKLEYIFPELKESEDERIKKDLIGFFKDGEFLYHKKEEIVKWLEKQGEHANFINKIQIGDKVTRNEDGVLVNLSQLNRVAKKDEEQGEKEKEIRGKEEKISPKQAQETVIDKLNEIIDKLGDLYEVLSKPYVFPYRDYTPPSGILGMDVWYKTHGVEKVPPVTCGTTNGFNKSEDNERK